MHKITILGDVMFTKIMADCNYDKMFDNITNYLSKSDLVIANLETPISKRFEKDKIKKYQFVAPMDYINALKKAGIDIVSTANNHCLDNGKEGLKETISALDDLKIDHIGTYKTKTEPRYLIKKIGNRKIAIIANTYGTNAFENNIYINKNDDFHICLIQRQEISNRFIRNIYYNKNFIFKVIRKLCFKFHLFQTHKPIYERNEKNYLIDIDKDIKELKLNENPDYIIMMMHDGGQNNDVPINRTINHIKYFEKVGVDAIITNHEHMIHKIDLQENKQRLKTYSLGNFISTNGVLEEPFNKMQDYSIGINIYFDEDKIKYTFTIFKILYNEEEKCISVHSLYDLINSENDDEKKKLLILDNKKIVNKVLSNDEDVNVTQEYDIER